LKTKDPNINELSHVRLLGASGSSTFFQNRLNVREPPAAFANRRFTMSFKYVVRTYSFDQQTEALLVIPGDQPIPSHTFTLNGVDYQLAYVPGTLQPAYPYTARDGSCLQLELELTGPRGFRHRVTDHASSLLKATHDLMLHSKATPIAVLEAWQSAYDALGQQGLTSLFENTHALYAGVPNVQLLLSFLPGLTISLLPNLRQSHWIGSTLSGVYVIGILSLKGRFAIVTFPSFDATWSCAPCDLEITQALEHLLGVSHEELDVVLLEEFQSAICGLAGIAGEVMTTHLGLLEEAACQSDVVAA
jgi:hypothetical protein